MTSSAWTVILTSNQATAVLSWLCVTGNVHVCTHAWVFICTLLNVCDFIWHILCGKYVFSCVYHMLGTNCSFPARTPENGLRLTCIMNPCKQGVCLLTLPLMGKQWNDRGQDAQWHHTAESLHCSSSTSQHQTVHPKRE